MDDRREAALARSKALLERVDETLAMPRYPDQSWELPTGKRGASDTPRYDAHAAKAQGRAGVAQYVEALERYVADFLNRERDASRASIEALERRVAQLEKKRK